MIATSKSLYDHTQALQVNWSQHNAMSFSSVLLLYCSKASNKTYNLPSTPITTNLSTLLSLLENTP